jgi:hypothetical protein
MSLGRDFRWPDQAEAGGGFHPEWHRPDRSRCMGKARSRAIALLPLASSGPYSGDRRRAGFSGAGSVGGTSTLVRVENARPGLGARPYNPRHDPDDQIVGAVVIISGRIGYVVRDVGGEVAADCRCGWNSNAPGCRTGLRSANAHADARRSAQTHQNGEKSRKEPEESAWDHGYRPPIRSLFSAYGTAATALQAINKAKSL